MVQESRSSGRFSSSLKYHAAKCSLLASVAFVLAACQQQSSTDMNMPQLPQNTLVVPAGFPQPVVPADNPITPAKVALGRDLFYETQLSVNNSKACASCHSVSESFSDEGNLTSMGATGERGSRNAPGLMNVAYDTTFFWDGRAHSLEMQAGMPILNTIELGNSDSNAVVARLNNIPYYRELFAEAFGSASSSGSASQITFQNLRYALATFERTLISGNSDYDRFIAGDSSALSASAQRGMALFNSTETNCSQCHSGVSFTDNAYHSTGLVAFYSDDGREDVTDNPNDDGKFRTPSLRNVALTAPYEHDGSFATLQAVVEHYINGGQHNSTQDPLIKPFSTVGSQDETDLINFLSSLTDKSFTQRSDFTNPDLKE